MAEYQGWSSWNAWNVALWMGNDEALYNEAVRCMTKSLSKPHSSRKAAAERAARWFLRSYGLEGEKTPDGAKWTLRSTAEAITTMVD